MHLNVALLFFFFNDTATTEIYTLSLHDALPIFFRNIIHGEEPHPVDKSSGVSLLQLPGNFMSQTGLAATTRRSEEHTSELQSRQYLVCRLLLEKKKKKILYKIKELTIHHTELRS